MIGYDKTLRRSSHKHFHLSKQSTSFCIWTAVAIALSIGCNADRGIDSNEFYRHQIPVDFGEIKPEGEYRKQIVFTNPYKYPLEIVNTFTSCKCAQVIPASSHLEPREETQLDVVYKSSRNAIDDRRTILLMFREEVPPVEIVVSAKVRPTFFVSPSIQEEISVACGELYTGSFEVLNYGDELWESVELVCSENWVTASISKQPKGSTKNFETATEVWEATFACRIPQTSQICVSANLKVIPKIRKKSVVEEVVELPFRIRRPFTVFPTELLLGRIEAEKSINSELHLFLPSTAELNVQDFGLLHPPSGVSWVFQQEDAHHATILVTIHPDEIANKRNIDDMTVLVGVERRPDLGSVEIDFVAFWE